MADPFATLRKDEIFARLVKDSLVSRVALDWYGAVRIELSPLQVIPHTLTAANSARSSKPSSAS